MKKRSFPTVAELLNALGPKWLPFADAATPELPLSRLLRLALFQVSVGMAMVLLNGTLNRVMIVEMHVPAWLVSVMISLPLVFAPFRVVIGYRSDSHRSAFGWRRVPFIWNGSLLQFAGFAFMPFALLVLAEPGNSAPWVGQAAAAAAFLLVGAGIHITQTAGLALATDLAPAHVRPRVVALLYVMLLLGMIGSALTFGALLADYTPKTLIQVVQGAAVLTVAINVIALWKQEPRQQTKPSSAESRPSFRKSWQSFNQGGHAARLLTVVGLGAVAFSMQDILIEPFGAQVLGFSVGATTQLTAVFAVGTLIGFAISARALTRGVDPYHLALYGVLVGLVAFIIMSISAPLGSANLFRVGVSLIGLGGGLFGVGTLTAAMALTQPGESGFALGAWGAVSTSAAGVGVALGGSLHDIVAGFALRGALGEALNGPAVGYVVVYTIEFVLLVATVLATRPLLRSRPTSTEGVSAMSLAWDRLREEELKH